jgi:hypothetical protein
MMGTDFTRTTLASLSTENPLPVRDEVVALIQSSADPMPGPGAHELLRQVMCREAATQVDPYFSHGELVHDPAHDTLCTGMQLSDPYDSASMPFSAKAYYFISTDDVSTPPWQGAYHFDHHQGPAFRAVEAAGGGHMSLQVDQMLCASDVLRSIARGGADLRDVLSFCPNPVVIDEK